MSTKTVLFIRFGNITHQVRALASVTVAGHTFLVHRDYTDATQYRCTYAPVGMSAGGEHISIEGAIKHLEGYADKLPGAIQSAMETMERNYFPLLSGECGIDVTQSWRDRERERFTDGAYKPVPVLLNYPADHFVHLSTSDTGDCVAYTPSEQYGTADRQVKLKFGRYLKKAFPWLSDAEIQGHVTALKAALAIEVQSTALQFATDCETINRVFETKMCATGSTYTSCMYDKFADWTVRPYHVYADSPDVAVAYTTSGDDIIARSVVSTKDKYWIRLYSVKDGDNDADCGALETLLAGQGYTEGDLDGNRLTYRENSNGDILLPYLDGDYQDVIRRGDYWLVVNNGEYTADETEGIVGHRRCGDCGNHEDDCECNTCDCCGHRGPHGCDDCNTCERCGGCRTHDGCDCERCENCDEFVEARRYDTSCQCDRCGECGALTRDCECEPEDDADDNEDESGCDESENEVTV